VTIQDQLDLLKSEIGGESASGKNESVGTTVQNKDQLILEINEDQDVTGMQKSSDEKFEEMFDRLYTELDNE